MRWWVPSLTFPKVPSPMDFSKSLVIKILTYWVMTDILSWALASFRRLLLRCLNCSHRLTQHIHIMLGFCPWRMCVILVFEIIIISWVRWRCNHAYPIFWWGRLQSRYLMHIIEHCFFEFANLLIWTILHDLNPTPTLRRCIHNHGRSIKDLIDIGIVYLSARVVRVAQVIQIGLIISIKIRDIKCTSCSNREDAILSDCLMNNCLCSSPL